MTKRVSLLALLGAFALMVCALPAPAQAEDEKMMDKLSGCLNPGEGDGWYVLTTEDGMEVAVQGDESIGAHAENHMVELTGKWVEGDDHKHFEASSVEHKGICE